MFASASCLVTAVAYIGKVQYGAHIQRQFGVLTEMDEASPQSVDEASPQSVRARQVNEKTRRYDQCAACK